MTLLGKISTVPAKDFNSISSLSGVFTLGALSIKKLTILGFTLVALPLVIALVYSAVKVEQMSNQATLSIFSVAELTTINKVLNEKQLKLERLASQYVVLKDEELKSKYLEQEILTLALVNELLKKYNDDILNKYGQNFSSIVTTIREFIIDKAIDDNTLDKIQLQFVALAQVNQNINQRSIDLINTQANKIKSTAEDVSGTMLFSLIIIPIAFVIAGVFIILITTPLKLLIEKIQSLEQGNFDHKIALTGSPEITEIAEALEVMRLRLHALELQKSSFIRHISHELKTPLAAIREGTELLYDNSVGELNEGQQEVCQIIKVSVSRLQRLIEDLLDFNIVLDSTSLQDSEKVYLQALLDSVIADHKLDIKRKKIVVRQEVDNIFIHTNAKQLEVILDNLVSNAIKYSPANSSLEISSTIEDENLQLSITDQGPGISPDIHHKVFEAFYQGPAPENSQIKGSGLGLTIVKELVMRLNGQVKLVNQKTKMENGKNQGTQVQIILPRAKRIEKE